jgi:hypothetical protein
MWELPAVDRSEFNRRERLAVVSHVNETVAVHAALRGKQAWNVCCGAHASGGSTACVAGTFPVTCLLALWP